MIDESLRQAVLGSANIQAPASPLGSFPELSLLNQSSFQLPQSSGAANILGNRASDIVAERKAAASRKAAKNYQRIKKSDGGYTFLDPDGNEISAYDYANAIGKSSADVLADSENPIDVGYQQDFKNLNDYINNKLNSKYDEKARAAAEAVEKAHTDVDLRSMNPQQLIDRFKTAYPTVYGGNKPGVPVGQTFIPKSQPGEIDPTDDSDTIGG